MGWLWAIVHSWWHQFMNDGLHYIALHLCSCRPSHHPVFDCLQVCKLDDGKALEWGELICTFNSDQTICIRCKLPRNSDQNWTAGDKAWEWGHVFVVCTPSRPWIMALQDCMVGYIQSCTFGYHRLSISLKLSIVQGVITVRNCHEKSLTKTVIPLIYY